MSGQSLEIIEQGQVTVVEIGLPGVPGTKGAPGTSWIDGYGEPLPAQGLERDHYLDHATGDVWAKGPAGWAKTGGNLTGPRGLQGEQGVKGDTGDITPELEAARDDAVAASANATQKAAQAVASATAAGNAATAAHQDALSTDAWKTVATEAAQSASGSAAAASQSALDAAASAASAGDAEVAAEGSASAAATSAGAAADSAAAAAASAAAADTSRDSSAISAAEALASATAAGESEAKTEDLAAAAGAAKSAAEAARDQAGASASAAADSATAADAANASAQQAKGDALSARDVAVVAKDAAEAAAQTATYVTSVAGRRGDVVLAVADVNGAAPLASPQFSGIASFAQGISTAGWGRRNYIQNSAMQIAQRVGWANITSTYTPAVNAVQYLTDRWAAAQAGATSAHTLSRVQATDTLGRTRTWASVTAGAARANYATNGYDGPFVYTSEASETCDLYNKPFTLSFQVRGTLPGTYSVAVRCFDGAGAVTGSIAKKFTLTAAATAQRVALPFPATTLLNSVASSLKHFDVWIGAVTGTGFQAPTTDQWIAGANANYLSAAGVTPWYGTAGAQLLITDVKLEEGTNDTPIIALPQSVVLSECRRHLEIGQQPQFYLVSTSGGPTTYMYDTVDFQEPKRAYPTISQWNWAYYGAGGAAIAGSPLVLGVTDKWWCFGWQAIPNLAGWPSQGQWLASSEF